MPFLDIRKGVPNLPKEKGKYTSLCHCWIYSGGFYQLWWIDFKSTICNSLQDFQKIKMLHDKTVLTLTSFAILVVQACERFYFFIVWFNY